MLHNETLGDCSMNWSEAWRMCLRSRLVYPPFVYLFKHGSLRLSSGRSWLKSRLSLKNMEDVNLGLTGWVRSSEASGRLRRSAFNAADSGWAFLLQTPADSQHKWFQFYLRVLLPVWRQLDDMDVHLGFDRRDDSPAGRFHWVFHHGVFFKTRHWNDLPAQQGRKKNCNARLVWMSFHWCN